MSFQATALGQVATSTELHLPALIAGAEKIRKLGHAVNELAEAPLWIVSHVAPATTVAVQGIVPVPVLATDKVWRSRSEGSLTSATCSESVPSGAFSGLSST